MEEIEKFRDSKYCTVEDEIYLLDLLYNKSEENIERAKLYCNSKYRSRKLVTIPESLDLLHMFKNKYSNVYNTEEKIIGIRNQCNYLIDQLTKNAGRLTLVDKEAFDRLYYVLRQSKKLDL